MENGDMNERPPGRFWDRDEALRQEVRARYDGAVKRWSEEFLRNLAVETAETIDGNAAQIDRKPPELETYDRRGNVKNEVVYHPAHKDNEKLVFEIGTVSDSFKPPENLDRTLPHLHGFFSYYVLCKTDVGLTCGVSMTASAALLLENYLEETVKGGPETGPGEGSGTPESYKDDKGEPHTDTSTGSEDQSGVEKILKRYFEGMTADDYGDVVQSGMFLTEKQGGSDLNKVETTAEPTKDAGVYRISGEKWFCSNVDCGAPLVLARTPGASADTRDLSLFLVPRRKRDGELNDVLYRRLKEKMGTKSVPTGEVEFQGAEAYIVGDEGEGMDRMSTMLNYERVTNAVGSAGGMKRGIEEAKKRAAGRDAFGKQLDGHPLMRRDLGEMTVTQEAATCFSFEAGELFCMNQEAGDDEHLPLLRVLAATAKYRTARDVVDVATYCMEVLGGDGYVEEYPTERLVRDAHVTPIWEGASNVLALETLRVLGKTDAHVRIMEEIKGKIEGTEDPLLDPLSEAVEESRRELEKKAAELASVDRREAELEAKEILDRIYDVYTAAVLTSRADERVTEENDARKTLIAYLFADENLGTSYLSITTYDRFYDTVVNHGSLDPDELRDILRTGY
ncbi:MAG: acyl-CoA dehydrogenase family protein [Halobacteria archaeon]